MADLADLVTLRTERLVLRPFSADHAHAFARFADHEEYRRYLTADHPDPATFVTNNIGADGAWAIEMNGRVVGSIFLGDELACLLDPATHGQGIGTEAARAVIDDGFSRRGYTSISASADPANIASIRALARLGFEPDGTGRHRLYAPGRDRSPTRLVAIAHDAERALVVALAGVLLVSAAIWTVDWYRSWGDPSRCPDHGPALRVKEVDKGGWPGYDTCTYTDLTTGATVHPDANLAGAPPTPVSFGLVLAWVSLAGVAAMSVYLWRRDLARRSIHTSE